MLPFKGAPQPTVPRPVANHGDQSLPTPIVAVKILEVDRARGGDGLLAVQRTPVAAAAQPCAHGGQRLVGVAAGRSGCSAGLAVVQRVGGLPLAVSELGHLLASAFFGGTTLVVHLNRIPLRCYPSAASQATVEGMPVLLRLPCCLFRLLSPSLSFSPYQSCHHQTSCVLPRPLLPCLHCPGTPSPACSGTAAMLVLKVWHRLCGFPPVQRVCNRAHPAGKLAKNLRPAASSRIPLPAFPSGDQRPSRHHT